MPIRIRRSSSVAVLEVHGVIGNHIKIPEYSRLLHSIATDRRLKALLLDIDSPGGSATGSEVLYREIQRVSEIKPVHAYVRGMAASGGYYLACAASRVYALPTALVGSIGVIYLRPVLEQLLARVGVEFSVYKSGEFKDMTGFWRAPSDRESEKFQELIKEIFGNFVTVVANGRSQQAAMTTGGFFGASELSIHFGLGELAEIEELVVDWPDGRKTILYGVATNQTLTIRPH